MMICYYLAVLLTTCLYIRLVVCLHDNYMSAFLTYCIFLEGFIMTEKKMKFEIPGQTVFEILILLV